MRNFYITRDRDAFKYKEVSYAGWSRFPDSAVDAKTIKSFFTDNARLSAVNLIFTDENLQKANIYEVRKKENGADVTVNAGEREFSIHDFEFVPPEESLKYFHDRQTDEINQQALKVDGELPRVMFYKKNSDVTTLAAYRKLVSEAMTDTNIRTRLENYEPTLKSVVHFLTEQSDA